jgi:hypothetical protein
MDSMPFDFSSPTFGLSPSTLLFDLFSPLTNDILNAGAKNPNPSFPVVDQNVDRSMFQRSIEERPVPTLQLPKEKFSAKYQEDSSKKEKSGKKRVYTAPVETSTTARSWKTVVANGEIVKDCFDVSIFVKSRKEASSETVDEKLYSSIKYDIVHKGKFIKEGYFLLCRIQVVDAETGEEIRKGKSTVLSGTTESAITSGKDGTFEQKMKIQFTDVSYHHDKKQFALKCSYFLNNDTNTPILVKVSPGFMVYARKPNQNSGKRKRPDGRTQPSKQRKVESIAQSSSNAFDFFAQRLDELINGLDSMNQVDKKRAMDLMLEKLFRMNLFHPPQPPQQYII